MLTAVRRQTTNEQVYLDAGYDWRLVVDDGDADHGHEDGGGHGFPCTEGQLRVLYEQIGLVLFAEGEAMSGSQ